MLLHAIDMTPRALENARKSLIGQASIDYSTPFASYTYAGHTNKLTNTNTYADAAPVRLQTQFDSSKGAHSAAFQPALSVQSSCMADLLANDEGDEWQIFTDPAEEGQAYMASMQPPPISLMQAAAAGSASRVTSAAPAPAAAPKPHAAVAAPTAAAQLQPQPPAAEPASAAPAAALAAAAVPVGPAEIAAAAPPAVLLPQKKDKKTKAPTYAVEAILAHKGAVRKTFLVKWVGYEDPTWQPAGDLKGVEVYEAYLRAHVYAPAVLNPKRPQDDNKPVPPKRAKVSIPFMKRLDEVIQQPQPVPVAPTNCKLRQVKLPKALKTKHIVPITTLDSTIDAPDASAAMLLESLSAPPAGLQHPTALLVPEVAPAPVPELVPDLAAELAPLAPTTALSSTLTMTLNEPALDDELVPCPEPELEPTLDDAPDAEHTEWEKRREDRKRARGFVRHGTVRRQAIDGELFTNLRAKATDGKAFINVEVKEGETVTVIGEETFATESGTEMLLISVGENVGFVKAAYISFA